MPSDNTQLNPGAGGDVVRTVQKTANSGAKTQAFLLDVGGGSDGSPEEILGPSYPMPTLDAAFAWGASAQAEDAHLLSNAAAALLSISVAIGATSGWLLLIDAATVPSDGAVAPGTLAYAVYVPSSGTEGGYEREFARPLQFTNGIVAAFSTTGPFVKTGSPASFFWQVG